MQCDVCVGFGFEAHEISDWDVDCEFDSWDVEYFGDVSISSMFFIRRIRGASSSF